MADPNGSDWVANAACVLATLMRLGGESTGGVYLQPAAKEAAIRRMQSAASRDLGEPIPEEYTALLRVTNGVQIQCAYFKSAEYIVLENLDVLRPEVIVLGTEGNMAEYVFDRRDRGYHTTSIGSPDERFASFDSFAALLVAVLREQHVC